MAPRSSRLGEGMRAQREALQVRRERDKSSTSFKGRRHGGLATGDERRAAGNASSGLEDVSGVLWPGNGVGSDELEA